MAECTMLTKHCLTMTDEEAKRRLSQVYVLLLELAGKQTADAEDLPVPNTGGVSLLELEGQN